MKPEWNFKNELIRLISVGSLFLFLFWGCTTPSTPKNSQTTMTDPPAQEVESGEDSPMQGTASGAPEDCVENDERGACHITTRSGFLPEKLRSEQFRDRCLRPANGSTAENWEVILSTCVNSKSRFWQQKRGALGKGFRLENLNSGKCIERVGDRLLQRTCARGGPAAANQTWAFVPTPPSGSGDFLKPWTPQGGCVLAINPARVRLGNCQNDPDRRWYQSAF